MAAGTVTVNEAIEGMLQPHAAEMELRRLRVRRELDASCQAEMSPALEAAFRELLHFVFATVPDGCEVYLATARSTASISRLEAGGIVLRWQVAGSREPDPDPVVTPLHPRRGDAAEHARSARAMRMCAAFVDAGSGCVLEVVPPGGELLARVDID
jgi:hypothetical protein